MTGAQTADEGRRLGVRVDALVGRQNWSYGERHSTFVSTRNSDADDWLRTNIVLYLAICTARNR